MTYKILHVINTCDPASGGPIEGLKQLCKFYKKNKINVQILCSDSRNDIKKFNKSLPKIYALGPSLGNYAFNLKLLKWLKININKYDLLIVHGLWQYHNFAVWKAASKNNIPYFIFPHGSLDPWFKKKYPLKHIKKLIYWHLFQKQILKNAKAVFFTTKKEQNLANESFSMSSIKMKTIGYGINGNPIKRKDNILKKFPFFKNKILLTYIGRIQEKKGIDTLINTFLEIAKKNDKYQLVLTGPINNKYQSSLIGKIPNKYHNKITWTGPLYGYHKWQLLNSSKVFCSASHQENFGISIVEALSSGLPVVITDQVNIQSIIKKYDAGIITKDNLKSFKFGLNKMLKLSNIEYKKISNNAYQCFIKNFTSDIYFRNLMTYIKNFNY